MRAKVILRQVLTDVAIHVHRARVSAVNDAVVALLEGGKVKLSSLGRAIARTSHKHGIKRIDRLLGNPALASELGVFYAAITSRLLGSTQRPVILVDWTETGRTMCTLVAAIPVQGRAVVIHAVTVPLSKWTSRKVEDAFLDHLKVLLGPHRTPILVSDAGFRAPWMRRVQLMGWDFITRIRGRTKIQRIGYQAWRPWKSLWSQARRTPRSLGAFMITRHRCVEANLVAVDQRPGRVRSTTAKSRRKVQLKHAKGHREPLFLATTLTMCAKEIVAIYALRMQIELTFRDLKSHQFGWGFQDARCRTPRRVEIQILLASLASFVCILIGLAVEQAGLQKGFQANTVQRRVLSLVRLGFEAIRSLERLAELPLVDLRAHSPFVGIH